MPRTGKKARLAVAAVLADTALPEPSPQKAKKGKQRSAQTPVEFDDSRDDSPAKHTRLQGNQHTLQRYFNFINFDTVNHFNDRLSQRDRAMV